MLYCGEQIGTSAEPKVDIAVDPLDGTSLVAAGREGAVAVIAMAERGSLFDPGPCMYMEKLGKYFTLLSLAGTLPYSTWQALYPTRLGTLSTPLTLQSADIECS